MSRLEDSNDSNTSEPQCPFCGSRDTELYALFGSLLSTSQHYCKRCRTVFERIKWEPTTTPRTQKPPTPTAKQNN